MSNHNENINQNDSLPVMMYLHGFMSGANGAKQRQLQKRFKGRYRVIAPELYADPVRSLTIINELVKKEKPEIIVGTSLGGFMALERESGDAEVLVVNPCMFPQWELAQWLNQELTYFCKRLDGVQNYWLTQSVLDSYKPYVAIASVRMKRDRLWALCSSKDEILGLNHLNILGDLLPAERLVVTDDFGHQCSGAGLQHLYELLERAVELRERLRTSALVPKTLQEFENFVRFRKVCTDPGYYRLTTWTYNTTQEQFIGNNLDHKISDEPSETLTFKRVEINGCPAYRVPLMFDEKPLFADFPTYNEAVSAMKEAVGKHNIYAFTVERLLFGLPAHQPYHTQAWMFDAQGEKIQTAACSAAHYNLPGIYGKFFGHFPEEMPYKQGDIVMIPPKYPKDGMEYGVLGVVAGEPDTIEKGYDCYKTTMRKWIRRNRQPETWLDIAQYPGSDEDEYFIQTGPYDNGFTHCTFRAPMQVFPAPKDLPEATVAELHSWYDGYLKSLEDERKEVEQMTEEISKSDNNMLDPENDDITMLKVALKGSKEALATAYRRSIRMLAEYDKEFGTESQPDDLDFRWEWIKGYRVLTIITNGAGIHGKFDDIDGITECLWAIYDDYSALYASNDREGILLNDRTTFGIPEGRYEI